MTTKPELVSRRAMDFAMRPARTPMLNGYRLDAETIE
jgi:hypothetical protein